MKNLLYKDGKLNYTFIFWTGLFLLMLARCFFFGVTYFNYLDDNNTYGIFYRRNGDIMNNIVLWYGLYTFRPIAFMLDAYVTQWFWPCMWLVLLFYTVMHFATVYLMKKIFQALHIPFRVFGILITAITPILLEAVYWIGASTRLVPGMFFSILSVYCLLLYLERQGKGRKALGMFIAYAMLNLVSTGFYEQIVVFNFVFTCMVLLIKHKEIKAHKAALFSVPFISTLLIGVYYLMFWSTGKQSTRGEIAGNMLNHFIQTTLSVANILTRQNLAVCLDSLRGFSAVSLSFPQIVLIAGAGGFSLWVFYALAKGHIFREDTNAAWRQTYIFRIVLGILLAVVPFAPFYILKNNYMSFRAVYPGIFGIALVLDTILEMVGKIKALKAIKFAPLITALVILPFFIINIVEVHNYKMVEETDDIIIENLLTEFSKTGKSEETPVMLFDAKLLYAETASPRFENVSSSDWALIGKANAVSADYYFKVMFPVREGHFIAGEYFEQAPALFAIDAGMEVSPLILDLDGRTLYDENGAAFGRLEETEDGFIFVH